MRKIVLQNLSITILSKIFGFVSFLYIVKILSMDEYGTFIYIGIFLSFLALFQFGSMHGTLILLPKYIENKDKNEETFFWNYNYFSHLLQVLSVLILFLFDTDLNLSILFVIALNYILSKYIENTQLYLNANLKFEKSNFIKFIDQVFRPIMILILFVIYKNIESIFIAQLIVTICSFFASMYFIKFKLIDLDLPTLKEVLKSIYRIGFFIYLVWAIDIVFRTADRWFISQFYSLSDLATYGFTSSLAMNIWLLSMSFFAPYAQLLYKSVAENDFIEVKKIVENTNKKLYILLFVVSFVAIFSYPFVIEYIVKKYFETNLIFFVLVGVSILLSVNNMYIYYMISNNLHFILLKYQSFVLVLNIVLNGLFSYYHLEIIYFAYSTILSLCIYYFLVRRYFYSDIEKKLKVI